MIYLHVHFLSLSVSIQLRMKDVRCLKWLEKYHIPVVERFLRCKVVAAVYFEERAKGGGILRVASAASKLGGTSLLAVAEETRVLIFNPQLTLLLLVWSSKG